MKLLLETLEYKKYDWQICADLKEVVVITWHAVGIHQILLFSLRLG